MFWKTGDKGTAPGKEGFPGKMQHGGGKPDTDQVLNHFDNLMSWGY